MCDRYVCPECGLDYDTLDPAEIGARIRATCAPLRSRLAEVDDGKLRTRPEPAVWSTVEYAAHLADAYDAFVEMVHRMRRGDRMDGVFWDPDDRATERRYNEQPLTVVLDALDANAERLAEAFDQLPGESWAITAQFPWGERDLLTMARNAVHEGVHHTEDADRVIQRVSTASA